MTCKVPPPNRVRWLSTGRMRAHAFERDHSVSLCGAVTMAQPDSWQAAVRLPCARCRAALAREKQVRG